MKLFYRQVRKLIAFYIFVSKCIIALYEGADDLGLCVYNTWIDLGDCT